MEQSLLGPVELKLKGTPLLASVAGAAGASGA